MTTQLGLFVHPKDGNVGIGTTITSYPLAVQGNMYVNGNVSAGNLGMFRNRIINGDMNIDQRNSGTAVTNVPTGTYVLDRFFHSKVGTLTVNVQQVNTPASLTGFQKCLKISVGTQQASLATGDFAGFGQVIEGFNVSDFMFGTSSAQNVTVSFWVYSSVTGTFSVTLRNTGSTRSYVFNFTIVSINTWQYISATIPGDTTGTWNVDNTVGLTVIINLAAGTTYQTTAGAWQSGNYFGTSSMSNFFANTVGSAIYITGFQLEKGTIATPFEFRPNAIELMLCQRYLFRPKLAAVVNNYSLIASGYWTSATTASVFIYLPVPQRSTPILTVENGVSNFALTVNGYANVGTVTSLAIGNASSTALSIGVGYTTGGQTPGYGTALYSNNQLTYSLQFGAEF